MVKGKSPLRKVLFYIGIILIAFIILIPFYFMLIVSLHADYDPYKTSFKNLTLRNYAEIFGMVQSTEEVFFGDEITKRNIESISEKIKRLESISKSEETYKVYLEKKLLPEKKKELKNIIELIIDFSGIAPGNREIYVERAIKKGTREYREIMENAQTILSKEDLSLLIELTEFVNDYKDKDFIDSELTKIRVQIEELKKQREKIITEKATEFPFLRYIRNSLMFAGGAALMSLFFSLLGGYAISRLKFRGKGIIQRSVLVVYLFGGTVIMVPLYQIAVKLGFLSIPFGAGMYLIIVYVIQTLPVSLYMLGNYFRTISFSIEEAAIIDGCTRMQRIFKIIIPLSAPAIVTVYIYAFMIGWNEYLFASAFLGLKSYTDLFTLPIGLNAFSQSAHSVWGRLMAASLVSAVPVIIIFSLMEKYLTAGFTAGGVKE
ncbi:carbohydrate ABC transporter permease [Thermosipho atlanticus]|uniref:Multiple sugar transport system permease protein n=1 Tax=Thermosipho atlanticus DSM 15807 TaxID=1123380 RepID=A0A1M5T1Z9_9BACT|nr:carbohydrate ABC transporter permease [Thermosipho atlanticus]SHH44383.1 multiple sugar transport system permease protein [Thermosipho atlanticus DSM 15807]